jgi:hypothetical protein
MCSTIILCDTQDIVALCTSIYIVAYYSTRAHYLPDNSTTYFLKRLNYDQIPYAVSVPCCVGNKGANTLPNQRFIEH